MTRSGTLGEFLFGKVLETLGGRRVVIEGGSTRWYEGEDEVARGTSEPLYRWHPDRVELLTERAELLAAAPSTLAFSRAAELARTLAEQIGAIGVVSAARGARDGSGPVAFHAVLTLEPLSGHGPEHRDDDARHVAFAALAHLADHVASTITTAGLDGARRASRYVAENATFFRALARYLAPDLPIGPLFESIAGDLDRWAERLARAEAPLSVAAEIRAASSLWHRPGPIDTASGRVGRS